MRQKFKLKLLDRVQSEDPTWKESGAAFISSVTRLLERLLDYRSVIQGDENRDKRMSCTVNLLNFYKNEFNRKEMYLRYIYKLHDLHIQADNYTEAGFTMKLYADPLSWASTVNVVDPHFTGQPEYRVKEKLYHKIIDYFDKGKCWEKGIPLCKELATLYETQLFDYNALSNILKTQAKFYDNILLQLRPEPEYFRVGFYGLSFPLFVRNKQFVYRGLEYERIGAFTQRLQTEFPSAQILMKNTPPDDTIMNSEGQFIQICNVKPIPEPNPIIQANDIPEKISRFYHYNDVRRFQCDRPVHKGLVDKENEIKSLWIERTSLVIDCPLPGILRWFEVTERRTEQIPPVQYACETMHSVERELRQLISQYTAEPKRNLNPFTMRLQGIIDANVQGGISKYQQAFFTHEFQKLFPDHMQHVYRLKTLILDVMHVLEGGLALHGKLAPAGVQPLHQRLLERFAQLRQSLGTITKLKRQQSDSIVNTPLPPLPTEKKSQLTVSESVSNRSSTSSGSAYGHLTVDEEDIYTKPLEILERIGSNRDNLSLPMGSPNPAPPIPQRDIRPRSQGFSTTPTNPAEVVRTPTRGSADYSSLPSMKTRDSTDNCELPRPPKPTHSRERSLTKPPSPKMVLRHSLPTPTDGSGSAQLRNSWSEQGMEEAPPLPPRGQTPDKRSMPNNDMPPNIPKRSSKKNHASSIFSIDSIVDISFDETSTIEGHVTNNLSISAHHTDVHNNGHHDLRDSGISITENSNLNNFNNICYEEYDLRPHATMHEMNINSSPPLMSPRLENPPPIPPKSSLGGHQMGDGMSSLERHRHTDSGVSVERGNPENYSIPRLQLDSNGGDAVDESSC